jgi:lipid A 3-O-deacylase
MAKSGRASRVARVFMSLLSCCLLMSMQSRAWGDERGRITILEENDSLYFNSDKHYTQGLRISDLLGETPSPDGLWDDAFKIVRSVTPVFEPGGTRRIGVFLGQSIFTPKNLAIRPPDPHDRPYAGWLYAGASLLQETGSQMLENAELDFGIVGPGALGKQVQNDFHQFIGVPQAKGWSSQLQQEFGIVLSYERLWRLPLVGDNCLGVDIVPQLGASVGNIFTYGETGVLLRIGSGLGADYGPVRIRPALSGTDYFDAERLDEGQGYYFFAGTQGRVVGRNIFLDGNSFRTSPSVSKKNLVGDAQAGFSVLLSKSLRFDISVALRTEEFHGQHTPDDICTAALTFTW